MAIIVDDAVRTVTNKVQDLAGEIECGPLSVKTVSLPPDFPIQPVVNVDGVYRFKKNSIVEYMVENGPWDLNVLSRIGEIGDYAQLAQQIGYSVDGWHDLSTVTKFDKARSQLAVKEFEQRESAIRSTDPILTGHQYVEESADVLKVIPEELPIMLQRLVLQSSEYVIIVGDASKLEYYLEYCDNAFFGCCSYDLDTVEDLPSVSEYNHTITIKRSGLWLNRIGEETEVCIAPLTKEALDNHVRTATTNEDIHIGVSKLLRLSSVYITCLDILRFLALRDSCIDRIASCLIKVDDEVLAEEIMKYLAEGGSDINTEYPLLAHLLYKDPKVLAHRPDMVKDLKAMISHRVNFSECTVSISQYGHEYTADIGSLDEWTTDLRKESRIN